MTAKLVKPLQNLLQAYFMFCTSLGVIFQFLTVLCFTMLNIIILHFEPQTLLLCCSPPPAEMEFIFDRRTVLLTDIL